MKELIKKILRKGGIQIKKYPDIDLARRIRIIKHFKIDTVFDIGASYGLYGKNMREIGYDERIISFEPIKNVFENLKNASKNDTNWITNNYAIGNEDTSGIINIAANSFSSSIYNMLPRHLNSAPESKYVAQEEIFIKKIDSIYNTFCNTDNRVMMKIDTQGYGKNVIDGAEKSLNGIVIIQIEMSIVPLYENEMTLIDMITYLNKKGYQLFSLENGFSDQTMGQLLQVDGIFVKDH